MSQLVLAGDRAAEVAAVFSKPRWYLEGRNYHVRTRTRVVGEMLGDSRFQDALDIGCGDGSISLPLLGPGARLTLLDMSEEMLVIASSRVPECFKAQVKTRQGNFLELELEPEGYDTIFCLGVLAYVDSSKPLIEKLAALLKPGGRLFIECTDSTHPVSVLIRAYGRLARPVLSSRIRTVLHSRVEVLANCAGAGLRLVGTYRYCSPPPVIRKMFSQEFHCRVIHTLFGSATRNRGWWLGNECIFNFARPLQAGSAANPRTPPQGGVAKS
ncbi:MAG: class I SAM-dependent methyltransferase [Limisphaerales bacterium]